MKSLPFCLALLLVFPVLAQTRHASLSDRAAGSSEHAQAPRPYTADPATGRLVVTAERRAQIAPARAARRVARLDSLARLPHTERYRGPLPPSVMRGGTLVLTVNSAYDNPDENPGDGICKIATFNECTLRAAIMEAVAQPASQPVTIEFAIVVGPTPPTGEGVWAIQVNYDDGTGANGALPFADQPNLTIDASTQGDAACGDPVSGTPNTIRVWLDGALLATGAGLDSITDSFVVRSLNLRFFESGILVAGPGSLVECSRIVYNDVAGVVPYEFLGSSAPITVQQNQLSANGGDGLSVFYDSTRVLSNLIGTDESGLGPLGNGADGIYVFADGVLVDRNVVSGNGEDGIELGTDGSDGAARAVVTNNLIGVDRLGGGSASLGNGEDGIVAIGGFFAGVEDHEIGLPGAGNTIGHHQGSCGSVFDSCRGIRLGGNRSRVRGNWIGIRPDGTPIPNQVGISTNGYDGVVGGLGPGEGNYISGNLDDGVHFDGENVSLLGNIIGLDASNAPRGNGRDGVGFIFFNNLVNAVIRGNTVSSNARRGISLTEGTVDLIIEDNRIGTTPDGLAARGNGEHGMYLFAVSAVLIGGTAPNAANTIAYSGLDGINTLSDSPIMLGNDIHSNGGLGVDLGDDGVDLNVPGARFNYPEGLSVENDGVNATITLTLDSSPSSTFRVEIFTSDAPDPSGHGEGQVYRTNRTLNTNASGVKTVTFTRPAALFPVGSWVTATATRVDTAHTHGYADTSEFSEAVQVLDTSAPPLTATITPTSPTPPVVVARGDRVFFDLTFAVGPTGPASFQYWTEADLPSGATRGPLLGPSTVIVTPPETVTFSFSQRVPGGAPLGDYVYRVEAGTHPATVLDSDSFNATVTAARLAGDADASEKWLAYDAEGHLVTAGLVHDFTRSAMEPPSAEASSSALPEAFALHAAYPNPFNPAATLRFDLSEAAQVRLVVYDALGREVARLVDERMEAGRHTAVFAAGSLPSGVYLARLTTGTGFAETQRLTLLR